MHVTWWMPSKRIASALRVREQLLRSLQVGLVDEDLAGSGGHEVLERVVDRVGVAVRALDSRRPEQPADHLCLGLAGHDLHYDCVVNRHGARLPPMSLRRSASLRSMKLLRTSSGISNKSIENALVELL